MNITITKTINTKEYLRAACPECDHEFGKLMIYGKKQDGDVYGNITCANGHRFFVISRAKYSSEGIVVSSSLSLGINEKE